MAPARQDLIGRSLLFTRNTQPLCQDLRKAGPLLAHVAIQLFKAVRAIGPNLEEGQVANSRRDMAAKYAIALREAREARHWFRFLSFEPAWQVRVAGLLQESEEFVAMLTVSVRKLRTQLE